MDRLPPKPRVLQGFYIGCPSCGYLNSIFCLGIQEVVETETSIQQLTPGQQCWHCNKLIKIESGEYS